jgi:hypothetical protein
MGINPGEHRCRFQKSNTGGLAAGGRPKPHGLVPILNDEHKSIITKLIVQANKMKCYLDFQFLHLLNHETVISCEVKEAATSTKRRQLP